MWCHDDLELEHLVEIAAIVAAIGVDVPAQVAACRGVSDSNQIRQRRDFKAFDVEYETSLHVLPVMPANKGNLIRTKLAETHPMRRFARTLGQFHLAELCLAPRAAKLDQAAPPFAMLDLEQSLIVHLTRQPVCELTFNTLTTTARH